MTFINSWAYLVAKKLSLKKLDNFHLVCKIDEGELLANITHFIHFFSYLNNKNHNIILNKSQYHIIPNYKRSSYNEISGVINFEDSNKNKLTLTLILIWLINIINYSIFYVIIYLNIIN
jgi:hypothetical protein